MKLEDKVGKVCISAGLKVTNFRIKVNKHSFKQLYSDLYSHKVRAIVRELATNAADAHVSANKPEVPFDVHLPSELEPYFSVKDYGTGLSPEQIAGENGIYITFFESDKSNSDDFTGCLGLGSKSPFAYTDNFMVESRYNGKLYSYACFHNEAGEPCIAQMGECDTTEPNGLKVEFAVKNADCYEFHHEAEKVLSWFKVKPNVYGKEFKFKEQEYLRSTERYGVRKIRAGHSVVVMGNVAYEVNANDFMYGHLNDTQRSVIEWGVDLFVDIGDVEIVQSRERLAMTDKTVKSVVKYLSSAIKSIQEELENQVQNQTSVWKARRMLHDIKHSVLGKVRGMTKVTYQGKDVSEYVKLENFLNTANVHIESFNLKKEHYKRSDASAIYCDTTPIYLNDLAHGGYARITNKLRENNIDKAYCVSGASPEFLAESGIGEVAILASSLPKPERMKRERVEGETTGYVKRTVLQEYVPTGGSYNSSWWQDVEVDLKAGGVYVVVSYGQIVEGEQAKVSPPEIKRKYNTIKALNPDFRLLAIRPAHLEKMGRHKSKWIKLNDYVNMLMKEKENLANDALHYLQYNACEKKENYEHFNKLVFEDYSLFGELIEKLKVAEKQTENAEAIAYSELNNFASVKCAVLNKQQVLNNLCSKIEKDYPLLSLLNWYDSYRNGFIDHVAEYIRAIDDRRLDHTISRPSIKELHLEEAV